ncbi:MAG TPA: hypothetical protein VMT60_03050, partial [Candidatus Bathyarchaeia archaeon]|nr:hypothetical protein [Candidatus Bathyarchaeia archaeon]
VDDKGARSEAAYRSFTARTIAPYAIITTPRNPFPGREQQLPSRIKFTWKGEDPIDQPWDVQLPESTRYFLAPYASYIMDSLNKNPAKFEKRWGPWRAYDAPGDSGTSTIVGDDEILERGYAYIFAVQAKDEAGAVTAVFNTAENVRDFRIFSPPGPLLRVTEPNLGVYVLLGVNTTTQTFRVPGGFPMKFSWSADASSYGAEVSTYRYGWDVTEFTDPNNWDVIASPFVKSAPTKSFYSGVHTLYIEATDNMGSKTLASFEVTVFPQKMQKSLLWVDDFYTTDFIQTDYGFPTKTELYTFWTNICQRAKGFNAGVDIYETSSHSFAPPDIELLWKYRNIIWSSTSSEDVMAWDDMVRFTPESLIGSSGSARFNFLMYYLAAGGHIWSEGRSDQHGGLAAVLYPTNQSFPKNLRCEIAGTSTGCSGDTSGVNCIAYRSYCVTVLDKVRAAPRQDSRMPARRIDFDAMYYAFKDSRDGITREHPDLPDTLALWDRVTAPGSFFDPRIQGFTFVEVYDPTYWMRTIGATSQSCFRPMYRMKARNELSCLDGAVVAFWTTKYADVVADAPASVAAPSVHFGFPLWYFDRNDVNAIADVIFKEWQISVYQ